MKKERFDKEIQRSSRCLHDLIIFLIIYMKGIGFFSAKNIFNKKTNNFL